MTNNTVQRRAAISSTRSKVSGMTGLHALCVKEISDHINSKRFLLLLILIGATAFAGLYGAVTGLSDAISVDNHFIFLKLYTTGSNSIPSFLSFIALLGPIVGLTLGFNAINHERSCGTLNRLVSQPIYRDSIIIGKFLAGFVVIAMIVFCVGIAVGAIGVITTGMIPDHEEMCRILIFLSFTVIYISFWLAISILFSVFCRHSTTSALASIAIWIFFALFMSMIANIVANAIYPTNNEYLAYNNMLNNYTLKMNLNRISPYYLYTEAVSTIMNPAVRSVNVITMNQLSGAINGYLSFEQSLLLVWPHLTGLIALMFVAFGGSYIGFMRQEVRAN